MIAILLSLLLQVDFCNVTLYVNGEQFRQVDRFQLNQDYELLYLIYHNADNDNRLYFSRIDKPENTYLDEYDKFGSQVAEVAETIQFNNAVTQHDLNVQVLVFDMDRQDKIILTCKQRFSLFVEKRVYLPVIVK